MATSNSQPPSKQWGLGSGGSGDDDHYHLLLLLPLLLRFDTTTASLLPLFSGRIACLGWIPFFLYEETHTSLYTYTPPWDGILSRLGKLRRPVEEAGKGGVRLYRLLFLHARCKMWGTGGKEGVRCLIFFFWAGGRGLQIGYGGTETWRWKLLDLCDDDQERFVFFSLLVSCLDRAGWADIPGKRSSCS